MTMDNQRVKFNAFTNVDAMGNYVGEYETLSADEDTKVRTANQQAAAAKENQSTAEDARLARQNQAAAQDDKDKNKNKPGGTTEVTPKIELGPPRENPLFDYANYTYGLSFHVIPIEKYNNLIKNNVAYTNSDDTVLVASAGRRGADFGRSARFNEDFYFENLKMTTVVGLNSRNKNTNAIEINFSLIEPYGFTFINRLLQVAEDVGAKNWFQIPFMLQIDFFGNDDLGGLAHPIKNQTKYIPVKLIGCKSKVTSKGSEYQLQAVPYTHTAYSETVVSTPAFFEVTAKKVEDFFSSKGSAGQADMIMKTQKAGKERVEQINKEIEEERKKDPKSTRIAEKEKDLNKISQDVKNTTYLVNSYTAAINSWQKQLKENKHQEQAEYYEFVFDPEIGASEIVTPKKTQASRTPMLTLNTPGGIAAIRAQAGLPAAGTDVNTELFSINAGTSIIEVINQVMRNTKYIRDQFEDPPNANAPEKPINWYKIVPVVELLEFDSKLDKYSRKITYYINKYVQHNTKFRDGPKSHPTSYSKKYSYMYTGQNKDVIDFTIDFDTMFYTAITADKSKVEKIQVQKQNEQKQEEPTTPPKPGVKVQNSVTQPVSGQADMVNPASTDSKAVLVNDFSKSAMSSSRGDMINVKLKIIGDPELIKQDDMFFNPANNPNPNTGMVDPKSNSIVFDAGEVFALLEFRTPTDFNQETGLAEFDQTGVTSVFSGLYKIITVENEFTHGQFTQTLDMIRLFDQPEYDTLQGSEIKTNKERQPENKTIADVNRNEAAGGGV